MSNSTYYQCRFTFTDPRETQAERCRRLLSGDVGRVVKRASEFTFTPQRAAEATRKAVGEG